MNEPLSPPRQWNIWHFAGTCAAMAIRLLPRGRRFSAALLLARATMLVMRVSPQYRSAKNGIDTNEEIALHLILHRLTSSGVEFDLPLVIEGHTRFMDAYREGRGLLLVSPHAALGLAMLRTFHDDGIEPLVYAPAKMPIPGTKVIAETVQFTTSSFVQLRSALRRGRLVCTMLDRAEHEGGHSRQFDTALGPVIFIPALLHLAAKCGARIAFCEGHLDGDELRARIVLASSTTGNGVEEEFIDFVRSAMSRQTHLPTTPLAHARSRT